MGNQQRRELLDPRTEIRSTSALTQDGQGKTNGYSAEHIAGDNHGASNEEGNAQC